jgi:hypothetical protein
LIAINMVANVAGIAGRRASQAHSCEPAVSFPIDVASFGALAELAAQFLYANSPM